MQQVRRKVPWLAGAALCLMTAATLYAGPWPASHADTSAFIDAARSQGTSLGRELGGAAPGPLSASVGTYDVTPEPPNYVRLAGYSGMRRSTGADGRLQAFAWLVRSGSGPPCAILGADLFMVTPALAHAVATEIDALAHIPRDRLLFTASHTHSSFGGWGSTFAEGQLMGSSEDVLPKLAMRWAPTVWGAVSYMRPATLRLAQRTAPLLVYNRNHPSAEVDPTVDVLQLDVDTEEPALLVLFGAHPTSESRHDWLSADYPGPMRTLTSEHVGAFVSFAAGALGSAGVRTPLGQRNPQNVGRMLATEVMDAVRPRHRMQTVVPMNTRVACGRAPLPLPPPRLPVLGPLALSEHATQRLLDPPASFHVSTLVVGPLLFVSFPGELSGEVTPALRALARRHGYALVVASFSGEYAGYLMPAERYGQGVEAPLQLAGIGASAPAVAFVEGLLSALPPGPLPAEADVERVWPNDPPATSGP
jgi:hypothetical protein